MPEEQANPSYPQPPSSTPENTSALKSQIDEDESNTKRTYLSLLPPPQLIDLILAIDANRDTCIFPLDLSGAIESLQRPRQHSTPASAEPVNTTPLVKAEPFAVTIPPHQASPTPPSSYVTPQPTTITPSPPIPSVAQSPPQAVKPPQYKPPPHKLQPHAVSQMHSNAHVPYYTPTAVPVFSNQPQTSSPPVPPPSAPIRHSLFTSAPLSRDATNGATKSAGTSSQPNSRDDPNAMPSYEEMIVEAIVDVGDADGTAPKVLFAWMASHYPLQQNFRPSASQALHKALRRGRLEKIGGKYRLNSTWGGGPTTSKRATRRPTAGSATISPPAVPTPPGTAFPNSMPPTIYQYGYHYATHPSYSYYATSWMTGQPVIQPTALSSVPFKAEKTDDMEEDEEDNSADRTSKPSAVVPSNDQIKQSLLRLANVLKRFAKKGEGTAKITSES